MLSWLVLAVTLPLAASPEPEALLDEPAIEFEAVDLSGKHHRLSDARGQVVLLNFWGIWCKSCRQEMPRLSGLVRAYENEGLLVLGADTGDAREDLVAYVQEVGIPYPVLLGDAIAEDYGVLVYPTTVLIDRRGRIRYRVEGYREDRFEAMTSVLKRLLDSP